MNTPRTVGRWKNYSKPEGAPSPKHRTYRRRQRRGLVVLKVEAPLYPLIEALLASGRLTPDQASNRAEVDRQAAAILEEWRRQWQGVC